MRNWCPPPCHVMCIITKQAKIDKTIHVLNLIKSIFKCLSAVWLHGWGKELQIKILVMNPCQPVWITKGMDARSNLVGTGKSNVALT